MNTYSPTHHIKTADWLQTQIDRAQALALRLLLSDERNAE